MEIEEIKKKDKKERRTVIITIRTFPSYSKWLKDKKISPSKLFNKALEELKNKS